MLWWFLCTSFQCFLLYPLVCVNSIRHDNIPFKAQFKEIPNSFRYNYSSQLHRSHISLMPLLLLYLRTSTLPWAVEGYSQLHLLCINPKRWEKQRPARNFILLITTHKHLHYSISFSRRRILLPGTTEKQDSTTPQVITVSNNFHRVSSQ